MTPGGPIFPLKLHGGASAERERKHPGKGVEKTVHTRHLNVCILRGSLCRNIFEKDHCCSAFQTRARKSLEVRFFVSCGHRIAYMNEQNVVVCMYRNFALKRLPGQTCMFDLLFKPSICIDIHSSGVLPFPLRACASRNLE